MTFACYVLKGSLSTTSDSSAILLCQVIIQHQNFKESCSLSSKADLNDPREEILQQTNSKMADVSLEYELLLKNEEERSERYKK